MANLWSAKGPVLETTPFLKTTVGSSQQVQHCHKSIAGNINNRGKFALKVPRVIIQTNYHHNDATILHAV